MENTNDYMKIIMDEFNRIKKDYNVESDDFDVNSLEEIFGVSLEQINNQILDLTKRHSLRIQKINDEATVPSYSYGSDSGFDLCSVVEYTIPPLSRALIPTGLKFDIPEGTEIQIRPKSGLAINQGIMVLNTPGTVDQGYVGEIKVILFNSSSSNVEIKKGMKVAQAVLCPVFSGKFVNLEVVDDLEDKERGSNGFGSTGLNI
jgi:dUTP pyrophosphatase